MRRRRFTDDAVMDEEEQEQLIESFKLQAVEKETFFRQLFTLILLAPTPVLIFLPYCRRNTALSLLSLISCVASAYSLRYKRILIGRISLGFASVVSLQGWLKHWPWSGHDFLWLIPMSAAITVNVLEYWFSQLDFEIHKLQAARYNLRGA